MFKYGAYLFRRDAREPLHELVDPCTVFKILEQRGNRHTRATEHPGPPDPLGIALDSSAGRPIYHVINDSTAAQA